MYGTLHIKTYKTIKALLNKIKLYFFSEVLTETNLLYGYILLVISIRYPLTGHTALVIY